MGQPELPEGAKRILQQKMKNNMLEEVSDWENHENEESDWVKRELQSPPVKQEILFHRLYVIERGDEKIC